MNEEKLSTCYKRMASLSHTRLCTHLNSISILQSALEGAVALLVPQT